MLDGGWIWLVDLSNLLMNMNALVTPILCFIFTRGFRDVYLVIRRPVKSGELSIFQQDVEESPPMAEHKLLVSRVSH